MQTLLNIILSLWQTGLSLIPVIVLLGILIFIHELGHFLVARWCGVRVEVFSLGFGKKILKWRKGHTIYCISLIPLGGYVKLFGHHFEPEKITKENQKFSFFHKPLSQRVAIVLAGPLMNFFLAILIVTIMLMCGQKYIHPVVGDIIPASPAAKSGFETGDRIISIQRQAQANSKVWHPKHWEALKQIILNNPSQALEIQVKKKSGIVKTLFVTPSKTKVLSEFGFEKEGGLIKGLSPFTVSATIGIADPNTPAALAGLKTFDTILSINKKPVPSWPALKNQLKNLESGLEIQFQRANSIQKIYLASAKMLKVKKPDLFIARLKKGGPGLKAGLQPGDLLSKVNNKKISDWADLVQIINNFTPKSPPIKLEIIRIGKTKTFSIIPTKQRVLRGMKEDKKYMVGIVSGATHYKVIPMGGTYRIKTFNPIKALGIATKKVLLWCQATGIYIKKLITNEISGKTLGGVIAIGQVAYKTYSLGLEYFFEMMALLSIQLFLLNLLPLPALDGGHLLFYMIEYFKGKPLSMDKMLVIHYIGFILHLFLFCFATFNDLDRWINIW